MKEYKRENINKHHGFGKCYRLFTRRLQVRFSREISMMGITARL